jgi:hypothetical protein
MVATPGKKIRKTREINAKTLGKFSQGQEPSPFMVG